MKVCKHSAYSDGHCAEMTCPNYFNRCPKHSYSGRVDAKCSLDKLWEVDKL